MSHNFKWYGHRREKTLFYCMLIEKLQTSLCNRAVQLAPLFYLEIIVAPLAARFNMPANLCSWVDCFESYFDWNSEDRFFFPDEAQ